MIRITLRAAVVVLSAATAMPAMSAPQVAAQIPVDTEVTFPARDDHHWSGTS